MYLVGLTGGIGSGKTTLASLLAERGAQVIDADEIGRDALRPGEPAWRSVVDQFGDEILVPGTMEVDRKRLAGIVFNNREKLAALNAITHPVIMRRIADELDQLATTDAIVIIDAALLVDMGLADNLDAVVVVTSAPDIRTRRLVASRRMTPEDASARMAAQSSEGELLTKADIVVRNDGSLEDLNHQANRVWVDLTRRAAR